MNRKYFFALLTVSFSAAGLYAQNFSVTKAFPIPGEGRWDYLAVSPVKDYLYVAHGTQVDVVNKTNGSPVTIIANTPGVHGIAFAPAFGNGYISNGRANTVTIFDINTNEVKGQIAVGENPDAIMFDPFSKMVIVCNGHSEGLSIIDPATNKVVKTIALGGKPETAVSDEAGKLFVNIEDKNEIVALETKGFTIKERWHVGKGEDPAGLAIDVKTHRLFAGCGNKILAILNAANGKVIKEMPIGDGCDGVAFDAALKNIYASNGDGTLTIIKENAANDFALVSNLQTKKGARTIAIDPATHWIYLPTAAFGQQEAGKRPGTIPGTFEVLVVEPGH